MDSKENQGKPAGEPGAGKEQPSNPDIAFVLEDGTEVTKEEAKQGYLRQSDYTKKTQALAEEKKASTNNPELEETMKILKDAGVVTKEDIAELKKFKEDALSDKEKQVAEKEFNDFAGQYSTLTDPQKVILKDLKKVHSDKSYDDILSSTGFIDQSLLEKSKTSGGVKGASLGIPEEKEEVSINPEVARRMNLKSEGELNDIKAKFNL